MIRAKSSAGGGRGQGGCIPAPWRPSRGAFRHAGGGFVQARGYIPAPRPSRGAFRHAGGSAAHARGYTLLEVLIAFSLLAIGLGLLLSILSGGVHSIANAADSTRASLYAESVFDSLGADRRLQPGRSQGSFENGRYHWTLDISSYATPAPASAPGGAPAAQDGEGNELLRVALDMQWGNARGNTLHVESLRAYTKPQVLGP